MTTSDFRTDQALGDTQSRFVGAGPNIPSGHNWPDIHEVSAAGDPDTRDSQAPVESHPSPAVAGPTPEPASEPPQPIPTVPVRDLDSGDQAPTDTHLHRVAAPNPPGPAIGKVTPKAAPPVLADPLLALAADVLDDLEKVRIANQNRLRQLTRDESDRDGEERGFGLTIEHHDVARLAALVAALEKAEHDATLNLQRMVRQHPLGPWIKATKGIGEKQGARLLAAIGDPYWNDLHSRPRTVSELWAYCGYHVLPAGQLSSDTHHRRASGAPTSARQHATDTQAVGAGGTQHPTSPKGYDAQGSVADGDLAGSSPGHPSFGPSVGTAAAQTGGNPATHGIGAGVAATPRRGQRANWSTTAKMRVRLIAESCIKQADSPYRAVYDHGRDKYADAIHAVECKRCGPAGQPAQPGSPISAGHQHARALRLVSKTILRDLWVEAKRIHECGGTTPAEGAAA